MKSGGRLTIPSITLEAKDLQTLVNIVTKGVEEKDRDKLKTKLVLQGKNFREEYDALELQDFGAFHDGLKLIELSVEVEDTFQSSVVMSTEEVNPFAAMFSNVFVEATSSTLVAGIIDEIRRFFKKRRNINVIFHSYGIPISIGLGYIITYVLYLDLKTLGLIGEVDHKIIILVGGILSHPLKTFLRWMFPYILFKGENPFRDYMRYVFGAIILGVLGNFAYALTTLNLSSLLKQ